MGVRDEPSGVRVALLALMEDCRDKESSSAIRKKMMGRGIKKASINFLSMRPFFSFICV